MQASIIIPVWNGVAVLAQCLDALRAHGALPMMKEIICVDNASEDEGARLIADSYAEVRLIRQPVNLGFAGGVNAGMDAAVGDPLILLNQDCVVQPGWLAALVRGLEANPQFGIAGCSIFNVDGTLSHAGAMLRRPDMIGMHLTEPGDGPIRGVEYVTGACFVLRRQTREVVGLFDDGFYPAYFEECDYCFRARRIGIETAYVPEAHVTHLSSGTGWRADPVRHTANQHGARYRFVSKHLESGELSQFFQAEYAAARSEDYIEQAAGRVLASRDTLRGLADILERRRQDLGKDASPVRRRQLAVGFTQVLHTAYHRAKALTVDQVLDEAIEPHPDFSAAGRRETELPLAWRHEQNLQVRQRALLAQLLFRPLRLDRPEPTLRKWFRNLILRPLSAISGRDGSLLAELHDLHEQRMELASRQLALLSILNRHDYR